MTDAVKIGFVPFSAAARGVLVVFCDDSPEIWGLVVQGAWGNSQRGG